MKKTLFAAVALSLGITAFACEAANLLVTFLQDIGHTTVLPSSQQLALWKAMGIPALAATSC